MKNLFKKIGALLVAAVMVLSMCTAVFAEGPTGPTAQIRIKNAGTNARFDYLQVIVPDTQKRDRMGHLQHLLSKKNIKQLLLSRMIRYYQENDCIREC